MYDNEIDTNLRNAAQRAAYPQPDVQSKLQAEKEYYGVAGQTLGTKPRRTTLREEMEIRQACAQQETSLRGEAIDFLRDNPAFDQFIALIRRGAIVILFILAFTLTANADTKPPIVPNCPDNACCYQRPAPNCCATNGPPCGIW